MKINLEIKIFVRYLNLEVSYIEIRFEIVELTSRNEMLRRFCGLFY